MIACGRSGSTRYDPDGMEEEWGAGAIWQIIQGSNRGTSICFGALARQPESPVVLHNEETSPRTFPWTIQDSDGAAPSRMIAPGDAARFGISSMRGSGRFGVRLVSSALNWTLGRGTISGRHSGKAVMLFAEGHVVGSEKGRQLHYSSWENGTRFHYDNQKHGRDSEMPSSPS